MCGSATLAMVESNVFIRVASIRAAVMGTRLATSASEAMSEPFPRGPFLGRLGEGRA